MAITSQKENVAGRPSTNTATALLAINSNAMTPMNTAWPFVG
ncbi:hypothetical protein AB0N65_11665 [Paenarthrobacter sp. NPDC089322]